MTITFGNYTFEGLKVRKYESYPWSNNDERADFYTDLSRNSTNYNKEKAIRFSEKEASEAIHMNLSRSYVFTSLSILCLVLMATTLSATTIVGTAILGLIGALCLVGKYIFKRKAVESHNNLFQDYAVIEMLF